MYKRGQVTIFIIVAILIVAGVVLFFSLRGGVVEKEYSPEVSVIRNYVQECFEDVSDVYVYRVSENGGYYPPSEFSTPLLQVPYYIYEGENKMPTKQEIGDEIAKNVVAQTEFCVNEFSSFTEYDIVEKQPSVNVEILDEEVKIDLEYPLTIEKGDLVSQTKDFEYNIPIRLGLVYDSVSQFVAQEIQSGDEAICIDCLIDITEQQDLYVFINYYDEDTSIFTIEDPNSVLNEDELNYLFSIKN